jgi:hypothetical protein
LQVREVQLRHDRQRRQPEHGLVGEIDRHEGDE